MSPSPGDNAKVTAPPTTSAAISLTIDSKAIARISPGWCSLAVMSRTPNRMANSAMKAATNNAVPLQKLAGSPGLPVSTSKLLATALSCSPR
jgi:hypothetical protein